MLSQRTLSLKIHLIKLIFYLQIIFRFVFVLIDIQFVSVYENVLCFVQRCNRVEILGQVQRK